MKELDGLVKDAVKRVRMPRVLLDKVREWVDSYNHVHGARLTVSDFIRLACYCVLRDCDPMEKIE